MSLVPEALVIALGVIVGFELLQSPAQMPFAKQDHPVQTLLPDGVHEPLSVGTSVCQAPA